MKKILFSLMALAAVSVSANAQWYVGGNVGLSTSVNSSATVSWNITPEGGYIINDSMNAGASLNFSGTGVKNASTLGIGITPYFRWKFWGVNSLNLWLEGSVGLGLTSAFSTSTYGSEKYKYSSSALSWGLAVAPLMSYDINDRWSILTRFASIGVSGTGTATIKVNGEKLGNSDGSTTFSFMAINGPSIGIQYRF